MAACDTGVEDPEWPPYTGQPEYPVGGQSPGLTTESHVNHVEPQSPARVYVGAAESALETWSPASNRPPKDSSEATQQASLFIPPRLQTYWWAPPMVGAGLPLSW